VAEERGQVVGAKGAERREAEGREAERREAELPAAGARSAHLTTTITTIRITCRARSCRSCRTRWPLISKSCWRLRKALEALRSTTATICWGDSRKSHGS